jgi:AcrR family transcriptional regulator
MPSKQPDTRSQILHATLELLEESQGKGVRMSDIAKRAGVSRQGVYLHFSSRAELLVETTFYLDRINGVEERLRTSRSASSGIGRLDAYIEAWGNYIPEIYGAGKALLAMKDTDEAAATAWNQRMQDMREGCQAAIALLEHDNALRSEYTPDQATDILWTMLSVRNWEQMTIECGWSQAKYIETQKSLAKRNFVREETL